jgi:hypothetical protein
MLQRDLGLLPLLRLADVLLRPGRQIRGEVGEAEIAEQVDDEPQQRGQFAG